MRKLPSWVKPVGDALAVILLARGLWVLRGTGLTWATGTFIAVMSFCLMRLSYLVFPRRVKPTVVINVKITEDGPKPVAEEKPE